MTTHCIRTGTAVLFSLMPVSAQGLDWIERGPGRLPTDGAIAFHAASDRLVLFGGDVAPNAIATSDATWQWSPDTGWVMRTPPTRPGAREGHRMVYDSQRERIVMFGGEASAGVFATGTWSWDGVDWQQLATTGPSPRRSFGMVYDSGRDRVVLFGGELLGGATDNETWEWDGAAWTQRFPATSPSPRRASMAYDPSRQVTVLFGGSGTNHTWEWDGSDWTLRTLTGPMPGAEGVAMAFDPVLSAVHMHGDFPVSNKGSYWFAGTTGWNGGWMPVRPPDDTFHHMVTDTVRDRVLVRAQEQMWQWDGASWSRIDDSTPGPPTPVSGAAICTDPLRGRIVRYGGAPDGFMSSSEHVEWDGAAWTEVDLSGQTSPGLRNASVMVYDTARQVCLLFGGGITQQTAVDTWTWDGMSWQQVATVGPSIGGDYDMVFDEARQEAVLFGGVYQPPFSAPIFYGETWVWDGAQWQQRAGGPAGRSGTMLAYDPVRQRVVMFGGSNLTGWLGDTWEWDGVAWTQLQPATSPSPRRYSAMQWDPRLQRIVLHGGRANWVELSDTWTWDGTNWAPLSTTTSPERLGHRLVYDPNTQRMMMHGGWDSTYDAPFAEDWWLQDGQLPAATDVGVGCGLAPNGPPELYSEAPRAGNLAFGVQMRNVPPSSICVVGFAFAAAAQPIGPCTFYLLGTPLTFAAISNGNGRAFTPVPLPSDRSFVGATLHSQGVTFDTSGSGALGLAFTQLRSLTVGF